MKRQILASRYVVARIANAESLKLYFNIGKTLDEQFEKQKWGDKALDMISASLQLELPGLRGFSGSNLKKMRLFYQAWKGDDGIVSSVSNQIENDYNPISSTVSNQMLEPHCEKSVVPGHRYFFSVSFSHHFEILLKVKDKNSRWYYINQVVLQMWSVRQLRTELNNQSHLQEGIIPNNFEKTMTEALSNKAMRVFKDQYLLDFVNVEDVDEEIDERMLEQEIVQNIKKFLMSLGSDFTFIGNQYRLVVNEDEYFIDLLFFHRSLQSLVAFELKKGKFKPEYVGKMNFYLSALDDLIKQEHENPSIGIILCKEKDNKKVEYSFRDFNKPMGVSVFKTSETLPAKYKKALPDAETLKKLLD